MALAPVSRMCTRASAATIAIVLSGVKSIARDKVIGIVPTDAPEVVLIAVIWFSETE